MFKQIFKRLVFGITCAIFLGFITAAVSQAQNVTPIGTPDDCIECHEPVVTHWAESAHGKSTEDPVFQAAWLEANNDPECLTCHTSGFNPLTGIGTADNVNCSTCHQLGPNSPSHPEQIMLTNTDASLCGQCHIDTYNEYQISEHSSEAMTCVNCHSQHDTTLKASTVQAVCIDCHTEESHFYTFTDHAEAGLLCTDCHLRVNDTPLGEGHGQHRHTFEVDMSVCNDCHIDGMHAPTSNMANIGSGDTAVSDGQTMDITLSSPTHLEPMATSSTNFILLAALIGLAFGVVGSPWVERWFARLGDTTRQLR